MMCRFFICCFVVLFCGGVKAQNLFDYEHTLKFAKYLYNTKQYDYAATEYERLLFLSPDNVDIQHSLLITYRLGYNYERGLQKVNEFFNDSLEFMSVDFAEEYVKLLILNNQKSKAFDYLNKNTTLSAEKQSNYKLGVLLLNKNWKEADSYAKLTSPSNKSLVIIANESQDIRYKSPVLAMFMSAVIPGSGKVYAKCWKDALISFLLVAGNVWQSYRGFDKKGVNSAYGWVFGTFAVGFYGGNVYGAYTSAKRYNDNLNDKFYHKTKEAFYSDF